MRLRFKKGEQRKFIKNILIKNRISLRILSKILNINYSTLKNFYREERLITDNLINNLCSMYSINFPKEKIMNILSENWGSIKGGKKGIRVTFKRYKHKLKKWKEKAVKNLIISNKNRTKKVNLPKLNEELSEFIGILLGDGTINKNVFKISGDSRYDKEYFDHIYSLIYKLFKVKPTIFFESGNRIGIRLYSVKICKYLNKEFNIQFGNKIKNNQGIPKQILKSKNLPIACLRGLIDTDGCVGKGGDRLSLVFNSNCENLMNDVINIDKRFKLFTYNYKKAIGTDSFPMICNYFNKVGSSNLRHIVRFLERYNNKKLIYQKEVLDYYKKYKNISFPYKGPVV